MAAQNNSMYAQLNGGPVTAADGVGQGLFAANGNASFNDVAEFEIYDRKFKQ